tara:strand:+ start:388 stop:849 length:462 start_codon:yes stop_codon:yes gene_type:complete
MFHESGARIWSYPRRHPGNLDQITVRGLRSGGHLLHQDPGTMLSGFCAPNDQVIILKTVRKPTTVDPSNVTSSANCSARNDLGMRARCRGTFESAPVWPNDFRSESADQHPYQAASIGHEPKAVTGKSGLKITSLVLNRDAPFVEKKSKMYPA